MSIHRRPSWHARTLAVTELLVLASVTTMVAGPSFAGDPGSSGTIVLPKPVTSLPTFSGIGLRPDRRLVSSVPGDVRTTEAVTVGVDGSGSPVMVSLDERLHLTGTGSYLIYERGPAREASPLGTSVPPVLKLGTVIWQGFSPGSRDLAARLALDPTLEAERLPARLAVSFTPRGGGPPRPLTTGGFAPGAGTVTVHLENATLQPQTVPVGTAAAADLVAPLDTLLAAARRAAADPTAATVLPVAGRGLPARVRAAAVTTMTATVFAPLRVVGSITAPGTTAALSGPGTTLTDGGGRMAGVLSGAADFSLDVPTATHVTIDLHLTPTLDERTLAPPRGGTTWSAWATHGPSAADRASATGRLVAGAGAAARAASISPYVGADTPGPATTTFRYGFASTGSQVAIAKPPLHARPLALSLAGVAALAILVNAAAIWRRS